MLPRISPPSTISRRQALVLLAAGVAASTSFAFDRSVYGTGIDGHDILTLAATGTRVIVAVFVATDCPISNRYLPQLLELSQQFASRPVRFWLVYPNPADTLAAVRAHQADYPAAAALPQLIAPNPGFIRDAHVHVTPEAALFLSDWATSETPVWHGRIDDRYLTFGQQRPAATHHDLAEAIDAALAGRRLKSPAASPVGCAIVPRP